MSKLFISYSQQDKSVADEISTALNAEDVGHFRDTKDIQWGGKITDEVRLGLSKAAAVLVIISPASLKSHWVPYEVGYGTALGLKILPYLTHTATDLPGYLSDLKYLTTVQEVREFVRSSRASFITV